MTYQSPYGKAEGLAERLDGWASQLGTNKHWPWLGLGIIEDLRAAAASIAGKPIPPMGFLPEARAEVFASLANRNGPPGQSAPAAEPELEDWEKIPVTTNVEYDL